MPLWRGEQSRERTCSNFPDRRRGLVERLLVVAAADQGFHGLSGGGVVLLGLAEDRDERGADPVGVEGADAVDRVDERPVGGEDDEPRLDEVEPLDPGQGGDLVVAGHADRDELRGHEVDDAGVGEDRDLHVVVQDLGAVHVGPRDADAVPEDEAVPLRGLLLGAAEDRDAVHRRLGRLPSRLGVVDQLDAVGDPGDLAVAATVERGFGSFLGEGEREKDNEVVHAL